MASDHRLPRGGTGPSPRTGRAPRLRSRTVRLDPPVDPFALAGEAGFAWSGPDGTLTGAGVAARIPVGTGAGRVERAAEAAAALLGRAELDDPDGTGVGPLAVGALPFWAGAPGELVVPALLLRRNADGAAWATATAPAPAGPPPVAELLGRLRERAAARPAEGAAADPVEGEAPYAVEGEAPYPGEGEVAYAVEGEGAAGARRGAGSRRWMAARRWPAARRLDRPDGPLDAWRGSVAWALEAIASGRLDKVVLAREALVEAESPFPRAALLERLRERAGREAFVYASDGFLGASPELLVSRRGRVAVSRPMAGTVPRGATAEAEARGVARLTGSAKETVEHRLVVDAVAEGLAKVADRVEVAAPEVVRLATVAHLATEVTAALTEPLPSALELAGLLHPTPAVGGAPREAALAAIAALEPFDRGRYAGPVGWVDAAGDGDWAVALRCADLHGRRARLLAGAGIVPGSDAEAEWAETEHKLAGTLELLLGP
jgi:menaquinone-specific isochorismate synthase